MANKLNAENQFTLVIEAGQTSRNYWRDLWRYRDLFFFLVWRDILVRYKQTVVGIAWVVIRPIMTMLVFTLIFGKLAKLPSDGVPYSLMVFSGMLACPPTARVGTSRIWSTTSIPSMTLPNTA